MTARSLLRRLAGQKPRTTLRGRVEGVCCGVAWGWAVSRAHPEAPATVEFLVDGRPVGRTTTTVVRDDNATAAASGFRCGFVFDLRPHLQGPTPVQLLVRDATTGVAFGGDGLVIGPGGGSGALDGSSGIDVTGWATPHDPGARSVDIDIHVDGHWAGTVQPDQPRADLQRAGAVLLRTGFRFALPRAFHDGLPHEVTASVRGTVSPLQDKPILFCAQPRAYIDVAQSDRVAGWIVNLKAPTGAVRFDLWVNGECVRRNVLPAQKRPDVERTLSSEDELSGWPIGFDVPVRDAAWLTEGNTVDLRIPGSTESLVDTVHLVQPLAVMEIIERLARRLHTDPSLTEAFGHASLTAGREALEAAAKELRLRAHTPLLVAEATPPPAELPIDVIVPVYDGHAETMACLHSVLAALDDGPPMALIVIHDAGPNLALKAELHALAQGGRFTLIENPKNLGFVATVNRGMRLHAERDVVLLNADTVVPRRWLQRLHDAARSAPDVATVTPLSNRATIFSLPRTCIDNAMPLGLDVHALDALCAERNPGVRADVPTAMGFCMYIRRAALADVGLFDEERWARGYAEENDFSLRATARGWRHLAACDVFVEHHGAVSFGSEKPRRVQENLDKLNALYPDYPARIERFIERDPLALARGRVNVALLARLAPSWVLFVSHGLGGGTDTAINDLRRQHEAEGRHVLLMRSVPSGGLELVPLIEPHDKLLVSEYPGDTPAAALAQQLAGLPIVQVHIHHSLGFGADIWQLPALLGLPFEVTLHDYFAICPRVTMIDASAQFCGEPEPAVCGRCLKAPRLERDVRRQLDAVGGSVAAWRRFHAATLQAATRVVAPSRDATARLARHLPGVDVRCAPHAEADFKGPATPRHGSPHHVAVIGAIGPHKGVDLLFECATLALRMGLPLQFVIFGYTSRDDDFAALDNVEITGRYRPADLPQLLSASPCRSALFLSVWPETYSYTLSEAWRAGLLPVALDIGAQAERIREDGRGVLLPFPTTARAVLQALMSAAPTTP